MHWKGFQVLPLALLFWCYALDKLAGGILNVFNVTPCMTGMLPFSLMLQATKQLKLLPV